MFNDMWYDPTGAISGMFGFDASAQYGVAMVQGVPPIDGAALKAEKLTKIAAAAQQEVGAYLSSYPDFEMQTFPIQSAEAKAWKADSTAPTPSIDLIARNRGIDPEDLRARTYAKTVAFEQVALVAAGKRQRLEDEVTSIENADPEIVAKLATIFWAGEQ